MLTAYQCKYLAWLLDRNHSTADDDKFTSVLTEARVDLNPHQIEAALFAFHSPLDRGAILADEVGLGKTIEAAIVIAQQWARHRRHILIIAPATLRRQWCAELEEKFYLPSLLLESKNFNHILGDTYRNPFDTESAIVVCSYQFARKQIAHLGRVDWDLIVLDEAHKLRNVYKGNNKTAQAIKDGIAPFKKLLLTATPLQNNVRELYGLISILDDHYFGSLKAFGEQYGRADSYDDLRERIQPVVHRTLRNQVQEYVKYTERKPLVQEYYPSDDELALDEMVSEYLLRDDNFGLPASQRQLISLVLHKLLSSSTFAVAGTLQTIIRRLQAIVDRQHGDNLARQLADDVEEIDELADEWEGDDEEDDARDERTYTPADIDRIRQEIADLTSICALALSIASNTKGECLLKALDVAFSDKRAHGLPEKALIFTESRRTQTYLLQLLEDNGYRGRIVCFSGTNSDPAAKDIYAQWKARYAGTSRMTGSLTADRRQALVDYFHDTAQIMIATEAAAEGINLQFCSLIVNYDMPWNPQRVEQRIGRCHRYGQKSDVVVVNFINLANRADQRVYQLLDEKYQLFRGVFGASDEVLGTTMEGVDFERRVFDIYRQCRTTDEIDRAFDALQDQLKEEIDARLNDVQTQLIENFDADVVSKLRLRRQTTEQSLSRFQQMLWALTLAMLRDHIEPQTGEPFAFRLLDVPRAVGSDAPAGLYRMGRDVDNAYTYRIGHPLAQHVIAAAKQLDTARPAALRFHYTATDSRVSLLADAVGHHGTLAASVLHVSAPRDSEDIIVCVAHDSDGHALPPDFAQKLLALPADICGEADDAAMPSLREAEQEARHKAEERNRAFVADEAHKIERWADDQTEALERELAATKRQIKQKQRLLLTATPDELPRLTAEIATLTRQRRRQVATVLEVEDEIEARSQQLIADMRKALDITATREPLFQLAWTID